MTESKQLHNLRHQCYNLVDKIVYSGAINKKDLFAALAIRLKLPINKCYIKNFDKIMCEKAIKELKYMIELNL